MKNYKNYKNISKKELKKALMDLLDGFSVHDIQYSTGLDEDRCEEIYEIYRAIYYKTYNYKENSRRTERCPE